MNNKFEEKKKDGSDMTDLNRLKFEKEKVICWCFKQKKKYLNINIKTKDMENFMKGLSESEQKKCVVY
jgi:hypothetical protein